MPYAPSARCTDPECYEMATRRGRCDDHQPIPWRGRDDKAKRYGISSGTWRSLKAEVTRRDHGSCYICGSEPPDDPDDAFELDHIVPMAEGGASTDLDNLGLACQGCHAAKSAQEALRGNQRSRERRKKN